MAAYKCRWLFSSLPEETSSLSGCPTRRYVVMSTYVYSAANQDDVQTLETIKYYFESDAHYIADPHTAVGLCAARRVAAQKYVPLNIPCCKRTHPLASFTALRKPIKLFSPPRTLRSSRKPSPARSKDRHHSISSATFSRRSSRAFWSASAASSTSKPLK